MAKVSICIPAYKDVTGISRLLNSILSQDYKDIEIFITDDTPDNSVEIVVKSFKDLAIHYVHNDSPLGPAGNWNKSISLATGEYIKIMHQDDCFTFESSLREFVELLDNDDKAVMAYSGSRQIAINDYGDITDSYDRCISDEHLKLINDDWRNLYLGGYIGAPSAIIYRNCDKRFDDQLRWLIDGDFYMNLLSEDDSMHAAVSFKPLVSIYTSASQLTNDCINNGELNIFEYSHLMDKYKLFDYPQYRRKLIDIAIEYKMGYKSIAAMNIPYKEYKVAKAIHNRELLLFYKNLIIKKLKK